MTLINDGCARKLATVEMKDRGRQNGDDHHPEP